MKTSIFLCLLLHFAVAFAIDYELVSFDPLPENAEELARTHVEEYLAQRYPEETVVVGEAIPLYVLENKIKALDFIMELDGEEPCTFEREYAIYSNWEEKNESFQSYCTMIRGNHEAWEQIHNNEDLEYNRLSNELHEANYIRDSFSHIVIAFIDGLPRIIGGHNPRVLFSSYYKLTDRERERFVDFGIAGIREIYVILKDDNARDGLYWMFASGNEYSYITEYPVYSYPHPMNFTFFKRGFIDRGKEDIPPLGFNFDKSYNIYSDLGLPEIDMAGILDCYPTVLCMRYLQLGAIGFTWTSDFDDEVMSFYNEAEDKSEWYEEKFMPYVNSYGFDFPDTYMPYDGLHDFEQIFISDTISSKPNDGYKVSAYIEDSAHPDQGKEDWFKWIKYGVETDKLCQSLCSENDLGGHHTWLICGTLFDSTVYYYDPWGEIGYDGTQTATWSSYYPYKLHAYTYIRYYDEAFEDFFAEIRKDNYPQRTIVWNPNYLKGSYGSSIFCIDDGIITHLSGVFLNNLSYNNFKFQTPKNGNLGVCYYFLNSKPVELFLNSEGNVEEVQ